MESVKVKFFNKRIIISLFILAIFYMLSFRIPPIADDFAYSFSKVTGEDLKNILDVLKSVGYE